jgi:Flp pilus assembly protein TadD
MQKRNADLFNEALALHRQGRLDEAEARYRKLLWREPGSAAVAHALGALKLHQDRPADAAKLLANAATLDPNNAEIRNALGAALTQAKRPADAEAELRRALALDPRLAQAHNNLSILLTRLQRPQEAVESSRQASRLAPDSADIAINLGKALRDLGRLDEALDAFVTAQRLAPAGDPIAAEAEFAAGTIRLAQGDFAGGWLGFEARLRLPGFGFAMPDRGKPAWRGEALAGNTILLHAEQGLGDTLQMLRYVPLVAARGGRVLLLVQPALTRLLAGLAGTEAVFGFGDPLPDYDLHCPLMSLPHRFGTTLDTIPPLPAPLAPPAEAVEAWRGRFGDDRRRIGLVWAGNPNHANDHNRSAPLAALAPLFEIEGVRWVSLQKDVPPADAALLAARPELLHLGDDLTDLAATAGTIAALDLVLSVDTAVAHLAGSMAKPVWLLLPFSPEWRWLGSRDDSPWYPTTRLFRQPAPGDWASVAAAVAARLGQSD